MLVHWEHDGAALLSVPTREYLQCSIWTDAAAPVSNPSGTSEELITPMTVGDAARPGTQLSLGSADPRYREFGTMSSHQARQPSRTLPDWYNTPSNEGHAANDSMPGMGMGVPSSPPSGDVMDHVDAATHVDAPGFATFDYGFADAFGGATPDSWDYRANRSAVVYDSGDEESEIDFGEATNPAGRRPGRGLELQTDIMRMGGGPSGVIISEGVALSPSDVDSDMDGNAAALASRFVMEERMRRVYGPLEGDHAESDQLDLTSLDREHDPNHDSDATEDGQPFTGPTRIGKLKKEKMRRRQEQEQDGGRLEQEELAFGEMGDPGPDRDESFSIRSQSPVAKPLPPMPPGVVEAWQAGLLYALTR